MAKVAVLLSDPPPHQAPALGLVRAGHPDGQKRVWPQHRGHMLGGLRQRAGPADSPGAQGILIHSNEGATENASCMNAGALLVRVAKARVAGLRLKEKEATAQCSNCLLPQVAMVGKAVGEHEAEAAVTNALQPQLESERCS